MRSGMALQDLLQDPSLAGAIRGLIQDNLRLAVRAHDILLERLEQEPDSFERAELERVCGVASQNLARLAETAKVLEVDHRQSQSKSARSRADWEPEKHLFLGR